MSADNWAVCPRCKLAPNPYYEKVGFNFREDYEIGVYEDGEFFISYHGKCEKCGLEKLFRHTERVISP